MVLSMQSRRSSPSGQYLPFSHAADLWSLGVTLYGEHARPNWLYAVLGRLASRLA